MSPSTIAWTIPCSPDEAVEFIQLYHYADSDAALAASVRMLTASQAVFFCGGEKKKADL